MPSLASLKAKWAAPGQSRGAVVLRVLILLLMVLSAWILVAADKPWEFREEIEALQAKGKKLPLQHHVAAGLFYASLINLVVGALALYLGRFWSKNLPAATGVPSREGRMHSGVFWVLATLAVLLAGGLRMNLAKGSLWWDELWNVKHTMSGEFRPDMKKGGELRFREVSMENAVYYYRKPTNHPPMSVASRLSLGAWRKVTGAEREAFDEGAVRLPSILAGLGAVLGVAVLLRSWGFGAGGLVAAFLLALHPWHLRYGVDGRAFSFAVLWIVLGCLWLGKLIRAGNDAWRYWLLFGLNQLMLVWSLPNGIYYAFVFGVAALLFCLGRPPRERAVMLARLVAVNLLAAMAFLLLFLPNALQVREWGQVNDHHFLSPFVLKNTLSQLTFGVQLDWGMSPDADGLVSFATSMAAHPVLGWSAIGLCGAALVTGWLALRRRAPRRSLVLVAVAIGAGLSLLVTWQLHQHFYHRYVVSYLIVPLVALVGIGAVELAMLVRMRTRPAWLPVFSAVLVLVVFGAFTRGQRVVLNTRSYAPFREAAEFVGRAAKVEPIHVIGYGLGGKRFQIYYPESIYAGSLTELDAQLAKAQAAGKQPYVVCGYLALNRIDGDPSDPGSVASGAVKVADPEQFEELAAFPGIEPLFYFRVMQARRGDADG